MSFFGSCRWWFNVVRVVSVLYDIVSQVAIVAHHGCTSVAPLLQWLWASCTGLAIALLLQTLQGWRRAWLALHWSLVPKAIGKSHEEGQRHADPTSQSRWQGRTESNEEVRWYWSVVINRPIVPATPDRSGGDGDPEWLD